MFSIMSTSLSVQGGIQGRTASISTEKQGAARSADLRGMLGRAAGQGEKGYPDGWKVCNIARGRKEGLSPFI